jgi:uncharacterized protein YqeY
MSIISEKIKQDIKEAMKSGDNVRRDVLRMIESMVKNVEIEKGKREAGLTEDEIIEVISRAVKQRKDSASQYLAGGRAELADREQEEIEIILAYLPKQLEEIELIRIIKGVILTVGVIGKNDVGKVIGQVMNQVRGRADGNLVRTIVQKEIDAMQE